MQAPSGVAGAHHTLRVMRQLINAAKLDVEIISAATSCAFNAPERDAAAECAAVFGWVRDGVRYQMDPAGVEALCEPRVTLARRVGDCDDKTTLLCSMFEALGYPTRLIMAGYSRPGWFEHVYCAVLCAGEWFACDATEYQSFGWEPPNPVTYHVES